MEQKYYKTYTDPETGDILKFLDVSKLEADKKCEIENDYNKFMYDLYAKLRGFYFDSWHDFENAPLEMILYYNDKLDQTLEEVNKAMPRSNKSKSGPSMPILGYEHFVLMITLAQVFGGDSKKKR